MDSLPAHEPEPGKAIVKRVTARQALDVVVVGRSRWEIGLVVVHVPHQLQALSVVRAGPHMQLQERLKTSFHDEKGQKTTYQCYCMYQNLYMYMRMTWLSTRARIIFLLAHVSQLQVKDWTVNRHSKPHAISQSILVELSKTSRSHKWRDDVIVRHTVQQVRLTSPGWGT